LSVILELTSSLVFETVCLMTVWSDSRERAVEHAEEFSALRDRLLALRKRCGWTQADAAEVLGVAKVTLARLEMMAGYRPRKKFLERLATLEDSDLGK
jgi:DNA-binding XRE family transcriptional regulator